jgi:hypothetical protein
MKKTTMLLMTLGTFVCFAAAASKINDESYQLVRHLVQYKNHEIDGLQSMSNYLLDCQNVSDAELKAKNCSATMTAMQTEVNDLRVKHDVLGQEVASHVRQHKDEEWIFTGLVTDDKEFSDFAR